MGGGGVVSGGSILPGGEPTYHKTGAPQPPPWGCSPPAALLAGANDNMVCQRTKPHKTKPFRRALHSWREGFAHREDGVGDQAPGRSSAATPSFRSTKLGWLVTRRRAGSGGSPPEAAEHRLHQCGHRCPGSKCSGVPRGSSAGTSALLRSKGRAHCLRGGCSEGR